MFGSKCSLTRMTVFLMCFGWFPDDFPLIKEKKEKRSAPSPNHPKHISKRVKRVSEHLLHFSAHSGHCSLPYILLMSAINFGYLWFPRVYLWSCFDTVQGTTTILDHNTQCTCMPGQRWRETIWGIFSNIRITTFAGASPNVPTDNSSEVKTRSG